MAEFGELRPGTEWRTPDGQKAKVAPCVVVKWQSGGLSGATEKFWPDDREDQDEIAQWVRWVEPIAVGDRVRLAPPDSHGEMSVLAAFTAPDGQEMIVLPSLSPNAFIIVLVSECRKVTDE